MTLTSKYIKVPIYDTAVIMYVGDFSELAKKHKFNEDLNLYNAFVWSRTNKQGIISYYVAFRDHNPDLHVIVHECVHLVNHIFRDREVRLDLWNDEPQSYFTAFIFKQITYQLNKLKDTEHK